MGWFSRSTATQSLSSSPSVNDSPSASTSEAPTATLTPPTAPAPGSPTTPTVPVTEKAEAALAEVAESKILAHPNPETQTQTPTQAQTQHAAQAGGMDFEEYRTSDDIFERFKVSDAMNELFACSSLGSNIRNYYRYGAYKDCSPRYEHLKFCLSIKTKSPQVAQVMIQKRDADLRARKQGMPNSEDVWTVRTHPPEELVELAREA